MATLRALGVPDHTGRAAIRPVGHFDASAAAVAAHGGLTPLDYICAFHVPSAVRIRAREPLEAFCLVAVEAQACGLPVLYQPVPGLTEVLADSAATTDFTSPGQLAADLQWLRTDTGALANLRTAGLANAARFPLTRTAAQLTDLTREVS